MVWKSLSPLFFSSIAFKKGSPYGMFMRNVIHQITEKGQLKRMTSRFMHKVNPLDCKSGLAKGKPLGLKKISFPFFVVLLGFILSGLTYVYV
jgi:hypothetical protein